MLILDYSFIIIIARITGILILSILAMASLSVNQAFAQCPTSLTLGAYPNKGTVGFQTNTLPVSLSGQLKTCGEGMGNTIITITGIDDSDKEVKTDNGGFYGLGVDLSPGAYTIEAIYDGNNSNEPSSATRTVTANENPQN